MRWSPPEQKREVALAGEDDHADGVVLAGAGERVDQLEQRLRPEGVGAPPGADGDLREAPSRS